MFYGDSKRLNQQGIAEEKPEIYSGSTLLAENTDYQLSYQNNTSLGTATCTVTGIGNYTGTRTFTYEVNRYTPNYFEYTNNDFSTYTGIKLIKITDTEYRMLFSWNFDKQIDEFSGVDVYDTISITEIKDNGDGTWHFKDYYTDCDDQKQLIQADIDIGCEKDISEEELFSGDEITFTDREYWKYTYKLKFINHEA